MRQKKVLLGGACLLALIAYIQGPLFSGDALCGTDQNCQSYLETPLAQELADLTGDSGHTRSMALLGLQALALPPDHPRNPLSQFIIQGRKPCLDCHNTESIARWWSEDRNALASGPEAALFPMLDFWQRLRFSLVKHDEYEAVLPNRSNRVLTAIGTLASLAAEGRPVTLSGRGTADLSLATQECRQVFDRLGAPRGEIASFVVEGCNLVTKKNSENSWARFPKATLWLYGPVQIECGSCHTHAGSQPLLGDLGYAAQAWPVYMRTLGAVMRLEERFEPCAMQSLGIGLQGADSPALAAIGTYSIWLAQQRNLSGRLSNPGEAEKRGLPMVRTTAAANDGDSFTAGREKYQRYCEGCHGPNGLGKPGMQIVGAPVPPLLGKGIYTAAASTAVPERLAGIIQHSMPYSPFPPFQPNWEHDPQAPTQIAAYLTTLGMMRADGRSPPLVQLVKRLQLALFGDFVAYQAKTKKEQERLHQGLILVVLGPVLYVLIRILIRRWRLIRGVK